MGKRTTIHCPRVGQRSAAALFSARQQVAQVLNCAPKEVFFTSGGSEADNQALISAAALGKKQGMQGGR